MNLWWSAMKKVVLTSVVFVLLSFPVLAQMTRADRVELFDRMEQMCEQADAEITRFVKFEGDAGARGVLKLVGAEVSGSVTVEQYENLEQRLNDFRTNPTICRFEAVKLLTPIFNGSASGDEQSSLRSSISYICNMTPEGKSYVFVNGRQEKMSRRGRSTLEALSFDFAKNFNKIYVSKFGKTYFQDLNSQLVSTEPSEINLTRTTRGAEAITDAEKWGIKSKMVMALYESESTRPSPFLDGFGIDQSARVKKTLILWRIDQSFDIIFEAKIRVFGDDQSVQDRVSVGIVMGSCQGVAT